MLLIKTAKDISIHGQHKKHNSEVLGDFAIKTNLKAGPNYVVGRDFIAEITIFADDYYTNFIELWTDDRSEDFQKAKTDLLKRTHPIFTDKTFKEAALELGLRGCI